jgi:hypothetical protein
VASWLAFTFLVAVWLTLAVSWRELSWQSQVVRVRRQLSGFESVAALLRSDWPDSDGERDEIGPFMAYPRGRPRTLLLLTSPTIAHASASISAIERATTGGLRFQLTGSEPDAWLEWHPWGSVPDSFRGGLMTDYVLERSAPLSRGWFVVRYRETRDESE